MIIILKNKKSNFSKIIFILVSIDGSQVNDDNISDILSDCGNVVQLKFNRYPSAFTGYNWAKWSLQPYEVVCCIYFPEKLHLEQSNSYEKRRYMIFDIWYIKWKWFPANKIQKKLIRLCYKLFKNIFRNSIVKNTKSNEYQNKHFPTLILILGTYESYLENSSF